MYNTHIIVLLMCLAATARCQVEEAESTMVTAVEGTEDQSKAIDKRNIPALSASSTTTVNEPAQDTSLSINSILIQILGGFVQNSLSSQGVSSEAINSAITLFSPEKLKENLLLLRRVSNFFVRLGLFLNRYLPRPSAVGEGFSLLQSLSSKIRFYTPSNTVEWVAVNKNDGFPNPLADVPDRIQTVVDFVTQRSDTTTAAAAAEGTSQEAVVTNAAANTVVNVETTTVTAKPEVQSAPTLMQDDLRIVSKDQTVNQPPTIQNNASSSASSQSVNINNYPAPVPVPVENINLLSQTQGIKLNLGPGVGQSYELPLSLGVKLKPNGELEVYGIPRPIPNQYGLLPTPTYAPPIQYYGAPSQGQLPNSARGARFLNSAVSPNGNTLKYKSIGEIPLDDHAIFDKRNSPLRDSFGAPIRN